MRRLTGTILFMWLAACGGPADEAGPAAESAAPAAESAAPSVGTTQSYNWYMEGTTPAGKSTIVRTGDGRIENETFVHWNNREYRLEAVSQLDAEGRIVSQKITGVSAFGAPIDEAFDWSDGVASWRTTGENGSVEGGELAFYVPTEWGAVGSAGALVRAAEASMDNEIDVYPGGSARVEKVASKTVRTPDGPAALDLYAVTGLGFTPLYYWFDEDMELTAVDNGGYLGMIPESWDPSLLRELSDVQSAETGKAMRRIAGDLALPAAEVVFEEADVLDVAAGRLLPGRHVHVVDGRIAAVSEQAIASDAAVRVDARGQTLMPGLWDMHGHFSLDDGVLNIAGGVVNVRDIGSAHEKIMDTVAKFDSGEVIGPNTWRAGFIDKAGPYASGWAAETLEDALERVDFFAEHGYIQIKLYSSVDPLWVAPIAERTHAHGMRLSGHIPAFMSAEQAVRAGYDEIQHINMVFLNFLAGDREDTRKQLRFTLYGDEAGNLDLDSEAVEDFIALLEKHEVVVDPTAAIFDTQLRHLPGDPDPTFATVVGHLPARVARSMYKPDMDMGDNVEAWARSARAQAAMLRKLHESGIQLVPGSDNLPAFTLHRELEVYAEAGIPVADVLRIATVESARVVGVDDRKGTIEVGKDADLLLVDGNPLEDPGAVRRATLVMKGRTLYQPDALYRAVGVEPFVPSARLRGQTTTTD